MPASTDSMSMVSPRYAPTFRPRRRTTESNADEGPDCRGDDTSPPFSSPRQRRITEGHAVVIRARRGRVWRLLIAESVPVPVRVQPEVAQHLKILGYRLVQGGQV